ncbi:MAG TPA: hypothetical protein VMS17_02295 [Gemmataceae bacterium]|nr:hypothetical protein [Gemmataceae bacterium]
MNRMFAGRRTILVAPLLVLLGGCVGMDVNPLCGDGPPAPGTPCQVTAIWDHTVHFTADPVHGGTQNPALGGRVYLFGPEIKYPMTGDGSMTVLVYDGSVRPGPNVAPLQIWQFDPATLHRLLKHDWLGWGYTLPLVWPDLPHDLQSVRIKVCYQPAKGTPLYTEGDPMAIEFPGSEADGRVYSTSAKPHGN